VSPTLQVIVIAAAASAAVSLLGAGVLRLVRSRSLRLSLAVICLTTVLAVIAATVATAEAMFLSAHDFGVVVLVSVVAGAVAGGVSLLLARQLVAGSRALRDAARALGDGTPLPPAQPPTAELAALSRELAATSARLAESRERERALEASRRDLVAWVSHDLRTPLAGLRAMAEALEDDVAEDPGRYHKQIRMEVDRLAGMVDDLFQLARIHSGSLRLSLDRVSLADLLSDSLAGVDALARSRGVHVTGSADGQVPVRADGRELARLVTNLVVNAIRHTPPDGRVEIRAQQNEGRAVLTVADGCGGIPEHDLPRVFDLAWRGTDARTPSPDGGAGLGLAIARGIAEAHQGEITVANTGRGCQFRVSLPLDTGPALR
jgi:signal transduction histidine kinase